VAERLLASGRGPAIGMIRPWRSGLRGGWCFRLGPTVAGCPSRPRARPRGGGVLETELLVGRDGISDMHGETWVSPGEELPHELGRGGVGLDELGQQPLPEEAHQQGGVPHRQGLPGAVRRPRGVGREEVDVGMPLDEIAGGGDGDHDAGAGLVSETPADELGHGLGGGAAELGEQLAPSAQERTQQPGDGQDDVAVGDRGTSAWRSRARAVQELPQHPFHDRAQRPVGADEAAGPEPQQLLHMAFDELVERRLARLARPIDPASDLHAQPRAGGRVAGRIGRRTARLSRGQASPSAVPGRSGSRAVERWSPARRIPRRPSGPKLLGMTREAQAVRIRSGCPPGRPSACGSGSGGGACGAPSPRSGGCARG
jgi:hypothetical protein